MNALSQRLTRLGVNFMRIDGSTKSDVRSQNVERFQHDPELRCALLSIKACNAGITLTAASTVIFAEMHWTPSIITQAESRVHRIGQEQPVKCFFLLAPGTSDDIMWRMLQEKQNTLSKVGLVGDNEHFTMDATVEKFEQKPSTSSAQKRISDFFQKTPTKLNQDESGTSEMFYSCEMETDDDVDFCAVLEAEKNAKESKAVQCLDFGDSDDLIDLALIEEAEKRAKESTAVDSMQSVAK